MARQRVYCDVADAQPVARRLAAKLPPARHWDADGLPKYLILTLRQWKSRKKKGVTLTL